MCKLAAYCQRSGEIASMMDMSTCSGNVEVKGNGVLAVDDKYGVSYTRRCSFASGNGGMVVTRGEGQTVISGCQPVNSDELLTMVAG